MIMWKKSPKIIFFLIGVGIFIFPITSKAVPNYSFIQDKEGNIIFRSFEGEINKKIQVPPFLEKKIVEMPKFDGYIIQFWGEVPNDSYFETKKNLLKNSLSLIEPKAQIKREYKRVFNGVYIGNISEEKIKEVKKHFFVKNVYPNYQVKALLTETIPLINATSAWALGYTGSSTVIAIIDTGIDYTHPMLGSCDRVHIGCKVANGYDFVNNDNDPMDDNGHGTHCAGIAAGKLDDGDNVYEPENGEIWGVAPDAILFAYKVLDANGSGWLSDVISGIEAAVEDHADIISMSLGAVGGNPDDPLSQAVDNAVKDGVVVVAAAGNEGRYGYGAIASPGTARKAITVGASDKSDQIASFSSRGPVKWNGKVLIKPDVVAPGVNVTSSVPTGTCDLCDPSGYKSLSGTSMATPHVAGLAALLKQAHPDWGPEIIKMVIRNTAKDLGANIFEQGYGRIDIEAAINVTTSPPIAQLKEFLYEATGTIQIQGSATNTISSFESYTLYYGEGYRPSSWNFICSSTNPVVNGTLCEFDTSQIPDGEYLIRLEVRDSLGGLSVDTNLIYVNNVQITFPLNNDVLRAGDKIKIEGRAIIGSLQSYSLDYGLGATPTEWITITSSTSPVIDGVLGTWDTSPITQANFYTLRLTVYYSNGISFSEYVKNIYLDPTLKEGWPKRLKPWSGFIWGEWVYYWGGLMEPVISDLEGDGTKEIIVYQGGNPPRLYVFKENGTLLNTWTVENEDLPGGNIASPSVADIDGDGKKEILVNGFEKIYIYSREGTLKKEISLPGMVLSSPVIVDLNNDRKLEIIVRFEGIVGGEFGQFLSVFDSQGKMIDGWPKFYYDYVHHLYACVRWTPYESISAVGNFDDDPDLEIVVAGNRNVFDPTWHCEGRIYVFNLDGTIVQGFPVDLEGEIYSSPAIGDIDKDGNMEIVVGTLSKKIYVIKKDGRILNGWPTSTAKKVWSSPALADFNGDGYLEIAVSDLGSVYLFDYQGNLISGWPKVTQPLDARAPIIVDITGDNNLDILGEGGGISFNSGIYAWDFQGNLIDGFPKITEDFAEAAASVGDIDRDGKLELVASSNNDEYLIYVWELNQDYNREKIKWPMFHHDPQHSGLYGFTALSTKILRVDRDTEPPFFTTTSTPQIEVEGEPNMKCRWGLEDLPYSDLPQENEMECGFDSPFSCFANLLNMGEDGQKTVYISCQDEFGNDQTKYQNLDLVFVIKTEKPAPPGGFWLPPAIPPPKEIPKEKPKVSLEELKNMIVQLQKLISELEQKILLKKKEIISQIPPDFKFTKPIRYKDRGIEVKYLQIFLKSQGFYKGPISGVNDLSTLSAIREFQLAHGLITPSTPKNIAGYVGPATRAKINEILESLRK